MTKSEKLKASEAERRAKEKSDHWLIVHNPWYQRHKIKTTLKPDDIQDIATWLCICLQCQWGKVHTVQCLSGRPFVIVKVDLDVDVAPRLGGYNWSEFIQCPSTYEQGQRSKIFEYDYVRFGDQGERQWREYYPQPLLPPTSLPLAREPPSPVWCSPPTGHQEYAAWSIPLQPTIHNLNSSNSGNVISTSDQTGRWGQPSELPDEYGELATLRATSNQTLRDDPTDAATVKTEDNKSKLGHRNKTVKVEFGSGISPGTQLIMIKNPFGVLWYSDRLLPELSDAWQWIQLFAKGVVALYINPSDQKKLIVRLEARIDLHGILGRHIWRNMLETCPVHWNNEVSTVIRCKEADCRDYIRVDPPENKDCKIFKSGYPYPHPFMHEFEDETVRIKTEVEEIKIKLEDKTTKIKDEDEDIKITFEDEEDRIKVEELLGGQTIKDSKRRGAKIHEPDSSRKRVKREI